MKKRKTYEISVIDKTYSKIISDETKFYTSDTALELGFELKETEYDFESAEIVLLNIDDRSLVTRPVAKVLDSFAYELDDDITAHYGEWRGQLRFEQVGETYVSSPVKFRIENDLSNDRPPQLSDVQSWVSLKKYADGLVDELKQAVLEVEGMDDTFNANETARQTTFETSESERNQTFESNELTRQTQEIEREKAECKRQSVFDDNETSRTETFNANEATRKANESTRKQSESERQSAELVRVENEEERVLNYENMKKEIDSIGKIKLVNLVDHSLVVSTDYDLNIIGTEITAKVKRLSSIGAINIPTPVKIAPPNQYYARLDVEVLQKTYSSIVFGGYIYNAVTNNLVAGQEVAISAISQPISPLSAAVVRFTHQTNIGGYEVGDEIRIKNVVVVDLTKSFGVGNEPTKEVMDWIISENGYFEELTLRRDDIQHYEINQLRKAVLALGGTI